jgi:hypothetical protein
MSLENSPIVLKVIAVIDLDAVIFDVKMDKIEKTDKKRPEIGRRGSPGVKNREQRYRLV